MYIHLFLLVSCVVCLMIAAFYFPCGIIIRTNIDGSKANMEIVPLLDRKEKMFFYLAWEHKVLFLLYIIHIL